MKPPKKNTDKPLGQILVERGVITNIQLEEALGAQKRGKGLLGEIIVELGFAKEEDIACCLSLQYGYPFLPLENYEVSNEMAKIVSKNVCEHYCIALLDKIGSTLTVAMANPLNVHAVEDLEDMTGCKIQIFVSTPTGIRSFLKKLYSVDV
ncbi:MAG: hypothetical protein ABIH08_04235 [Candidatus Omnitrophota bacterium]